MPWDHYVPSAVDTQATGLVSSDMEDWWNRGWVCMQCGICYPRFGHCFTEGSGICALCVQIAFVAREKRRRQYEYDYLVRRGRRLRVQAKDIFGNDLSDNEPAKNENQIKRYAKLSSKLGSTWHEKSGKRFCVPTASYVTGGCSSRICCGSRWRGRIGRRSLGANRRSSP